MTGKKRHPFYNSKWQGARADYLARHPLCVMCQTAGRLTPATVVDHVVPHKGDASRFWDQSNWQALCAPHHNSAKQSAEKLEETYGMPSAPCDENGYPRWGDW